MPIVCWRASRRVGSHGRMMSGGIMSGGMISEGKMSYVEECLRKV